MRPHRVQRRRVKGWLMPPSTVSITRPGPWGNPFPVMNGDQQQAVRLFRAWLLGTNRGLAVLERGKVALKGKNLACWCREDQPCHGDVWLEILNDTEVT